MPLNTRLMAVLMLLVTVITWGGMYHVVKTALPVIDAYWLVLVRYGFTTLFFCFLLIWREGATALRFDGYGVETWWYGTLGFAMFNYFVFLA